MNKKQNLTVKQLSEQLAKEVAKIIKEEYSPLLHQNGTEQPIGHVVDDHVGCIYVVKVPVEGAQPEDLVMETTSIGLADKVATGELPKEGIRHIFKKPDVAHKTAKKLIKEFNKNLLETRIHRIAELNRKKDYTQAKIDATNKYYEGRQLDEAQTVKIKELEEVVKKIDKQISLLQKKIDESKGKK